MSILEQLSSALGRRDEIPNQELAKRIADSKDKKAILELIENLDNKKKDIQQDCIKVLYEIGAIDPKLIAEYHDEFAALLESKNNRMQWGGMTALNSITLQKPEIIMTNLHRLIEVAEAGSVITKDNLMGILTKLISLPAYSKQAFPLLNEQLKKCPSNQLPMYAENM